MKAGPFVPEVVLRCPEALKELSLEYLRAGSEIILACTYYGYRTKLRAIGGEDLLENLNVQAAVLAREGGALATGNLSNTWEWDPRNPVKSSELVRKMSEEQIGWAIEGRVDLIIAETFSYLGETLIALEVIKQAGLPSVVTFILLEDTTRNGYSWPEACHILEDQGADVVGLNCGRGPETMLSLLEQVLKAISGFVAALPVPYRTTVEQPSFYDLERPGEKSVFPVALDPFLLTRFEMADFAIKARDMGIHYIGSCCGTGPHHIRVMAEALGSKVPASEYSPDLRLHPIVGDGAPKKRHFG